MATRRKQVLIDDGDWHLDKKVPVSIIAAIIMQTFAMGWWISAANADIDALKSGIQELKTEAKERAVKIDKLIELDVEIRNLRATMVRIEGILDKGLASAVRQNVSGKARAKNDDN